MVNENKDDMKEFEEEFDFESEETTNNDLPTEDDDALGDPATGHTESRSAAQGITIDKKQSKLPWLIGLAAAGFIGWQGYKIIFAQPADEVGVPIVKQESKTQTQAQSKPETLPTPDNKAGTIPDQSMSVTSTTTTQTTTVPSPSKSPDLFAAPLSSPGQSTSTVIAKPGQLEVLEENFKNSQERMGKLDSKFSELMDAMGSLNQGMSQVTRELSTINDSVQKLNKDVKTLKSQVQTPQQSSAPQALQRPLSEGDMQPIYSVNKYETKPAAPSQTMSGTPTMSVHAIIPGRAWLKSKDGSTITVTEGDTLDRYGKVLVIDASNGVVITSSGATLR